VERDITPRLGPVWTVVLAAGFVCAIVLPGVATIAGVDREIAKGENRELAPAPAVGMDWDTIRKFPRDASRYFEDHFAFRARLVRWQSALRLRFLHTSSSPDVIAGRDGWMFYAADGGAEDYASAVPFSQEELEQWRATLQHTRDWLAARGVAYLFVLTPDKHVIYPEYLPASMRRIGAESRTDQLVRYLRDHSTVPVLDLRPALFAAKARERLYHRTDTHWNPRGAYVGYRAIVHALGRDVVGLPAPAEAFAATETVVPGMDLAGMLGLTETLQEADLELVPRVPRAARVTEPGEFDPHWHEARLVTEQADTRLPRAVIFRDSFGSALVPFLSEHFSRALYLWQYNMDPDAVKAERATVVVQQWVGRRLGTMLPYDPFAERR